MFKLGFWYYLLNIPVNLLLSSYKVQDRMMLVNTMSFFETAVIGVLAMLLVPVLDIRAVWLSGLIGDAISLSLIFISVFAEKKRLDMSWASLVNFLTTLVRMQMSIWNNLCAPKKRCQPFLTQ